MISIEWILALLPKRMDFRINSRFLSMLCPIIKFCYKIRQFLQLSKTTKLNFMNINEGFKNTKSSDH